MKVIAISQRLIDNETYPETRDCLDVRWGRLCARLGVLPLVLPSEVEPEQYFDAFSPAAVIFTGGNDVSSVSTSALSVSRDAYEKRLFALAETRRVPVFAVCRGMQLLGVHFGSALAKVAGHTKGVTHAITIDPATRYGALLNGLEAVRSYHDYALTDAPKGFKAVARSADGVLEAMEHDTLPIFCQMWHPEREETLTEGETAVIRALFGISAINEEKQKR